jgi:hypothetical protein
MKNFFFRLLDVISWGFLFIGVNGASFVRRNSDIWVTGYNYVESVTFMQKCNSISLWGRWVKLVTLCRRYGVNWSVFLVLKNIF